MRLVPDSPARGDPERGVHTWMKQGVLASGSWSQVAFAPHGIASGGFVKVTPRSTSDWQVSRCPRR
ncbi:MAG: hypothetical protein AVDCRST_MAG87-2044 [uncultured Thermomicrobiales bacterium]|uniref:Uncharacterized protein n=1 Tax=uncultured Thermomicrobiales bacterium TaxID=1645740 RepID=A0A6J4V825_9BACT|nr:MAG: hypothetical protein AVDCRST_MAG87-2044 [uncultured Thermomicrobiales bacterium]